jgi:hypothetical protein
MSTPRGSILCPSRKIELGGAVITGRKPGILITVKSGSGRLLREFTRYCEHLGVHSFGVQSFSENGRSDVFECLGSIDALERLIGHAAVRDWSYILNVRPPRWAMGTGNADGVNAKRSIRDTKLSQPDRRAAAEWERRARLTRDEVDDIELFEAKQRRDALAK